MNAYPVFAPVGTVTVLNIARATEPASVRYMGASAHVTGQARLTPAEAEADVRNWHQGKPVSYPKHAEMPAGYTDRLLGRQYAANCALVP